MTMRQAYLAFITSEPGTSPNGRTDRVPPQALRVGRVSPWKNNLPLTAPFTSFSWRTTPRSSRTPGASSKPGGVGFIAAESAEAALRQVELTRFDLILTDNILPGMTGFQALPRLRASGAPVIVMSSQYGPDTEKDALLRGASSFIKKPLVVNELLRLIRQALDSGAPGSESLDGRVYAG